MGEASHYLFVCYSNVNRSPRAAEWFWQYCTSHDIPAQVRSTGTNVEELAKRRNPDARQLTEEDLAWADKILAMDGDIYREILDGYAHIQGIKQKLDNLRISDKFSPSHSDPRNIAEIEAMSPAEFKEWLAEEGADILGIGPRLFDRLMQSRLEQILGE